MWQVFSACKQRGTIAKGCKILEQQLQQMRATYQLNQEKLEYNFQVLKKRDEENTITKSQQKRKITRMQDVLNGLRLKLAKQEKQYRDENTQLTEDYKRITEQFRDVQKKSKHFMAIDFKKFHDIWCMNEEESKELMDTVMAADKIIHEQQMGLTWIQPDISFAENVGPLLGKAASQGLSANQIVQEVLSLTEHSEDGEGQGQERAAIFSKISANTIKQILELLCDESGFLIESKLNKLLQPLEKDDRSLIKLDAIFAALQIETEEDIHNLSTYFMHLREQVAGEADVDEKEDKEKERSEASSSKGDDLDEEVRGLSSKGLDATSIKSDSVDLVHPNEVLKALRAFVEDNIHPLKMGANRSQFRITALDARDCSEDSEYWLKYSHLLTEGKERVWEALVDGLDKYHETLASRGDRLSETDALRTQNAELRLLLHQYVNSKVNTELEIPPTRVLQLELNPR